MFTYYQQRDLRLDERYLQNRRVIFDLLVLGLASPQQLQQSTQRHLFNGSQVGEVLHSKTVDYKTFKPLRDGLFCERIFGPVTNYKCACGKQQPNPEITFCPECEVEYAPSALRRRRLGHVALFSAVTHIWYLKGRPNYHAVLLKRKAKAVDSLVYCTTVMVDAYHAGILPEPTGDKSRIIADPFVPAQTVPVTTKFCCDPLHKAKFLQYFISEPQEGDAPLWPYLDPTVPTKTRAAIDFFDPVNADISFSEMIQAHLLSREQGIRDLLSSTGGDALHTLLDRIDIPRLMTLLAGEIRKINPQVKALSALRPRIPRNIRVLRTLLQRRLNHVQRFKLAETFYRTNKKPAWMVITTLPVLPPDLRPIIVVDEQVMASDLNRLYQRVLFRNNRMKRLRILDLENIGYTKRLLQEAVDSLIDNGKGGIAPVLGTHDKPLRSLSDRLKGKRGRFRLNLLGKRVDYSGRSVIVVGPKMRLHACGLPREMALELFYPFLIRRLLEVGYVDNLVKAKRYLDRRHPTIWPALHAIMKQLPILLNRAPTLHRLGIQAFQPQLVAGQAILLHPLVCSAFNADFDGDQMAVHVPLSYAARAEAWKLIWSRNNLLAPATGQPILVPSQDMVLGCYYLTTDGFVEPGPRRLKSAPALPGYGLYFASGSDARQALDQEHIGISTLVWLQMDLGVQCETAKPPREPTEIQVSPDGDGLILSQMRQDRVAYSLSTDKTAFFQAYRHPLRCYVRTTVGRILVNSIIGGEPTLPTASWQHYLDEAFKESTEVPWDDVLKTFRTAVEKEAGLLENKAKTA